MIEIPYLSITALACLVGDTKLFIAVLNDVPA